MTAQQATARAVINAARDIERAVQYGLDTFPAHRAYDQARAEQADTRARYRRHPWNLKQGETGERRD